jgi:hypothetical protein
MPHPALLVDHITLEDHRALHEPAREEQEPAGGHPPGVYESHRRQLRLSVTAITIDETGATFGLGVGVAF